MIDVIVALVGVLFCGGILYWLRKENLKEKARIEQREEEFLELERLKEKHLKKIALYLDVYTNLLCEKEN